MKRISLCSTGGLDWPIREVNAFDNGMNGNSNHYGLGNDFHQMASASTDFCNEKKV